MAPTSPFPAMPSPSWSYHGSPDPSSPEKILDPRQAQQSGTISNKNTPTSNMDGHLAMPQSRTQSTTSLQNTPEVLRPSSRSDSHLPSALSLPEAARPPPKPTSAYSNTSQSNTTLVSNNSSGAMADAVSIGKNSGLIRRISRGARQQLRRRQSTNNSNRDHSSGPVVVRRRSDSRSITDSAMDISDFELDYGDEDPLEDCWPSTELRPADAVVNGLGISNPVPNARIPLSAIKAIAPTRSDDLERGVLLTKVTKKKKKRKMAKFRIDYDSAKVTWRESKTFYIDDISEIRVGKDARVYREECQVTVEEEPLWFTIVCYAPQRPLHFIAPTAKSLKEWVTNLETVRKNRLEMMAGLAGAGEKSVKMCWDREMQRAPHPDDRIDLSCLRKLCRSLHINCSENALRHQFEQVADASGHIGFSQFRDFIRRLKERRDLKEIFNEALRPGFAELSEASFLAFLTDVQRTNVNDDRPFWASHFEKHSRLDEQGDRWMAFSGFQSFMLSSANSALAPRKVDAKLDRPMNEYIISSSHNTYLVGRQVAGESSTEQYISALQKGCRCIEIDCWDGNDGKPIVMHGRTLTSSVLFSDCIYTVAKYAFVTSPYPLIISLEVHCSPEQQKVMVEIMKEGFREQLILEPIDTDSQILPSPEDLKRKVLIKVKAADDTEPIPQLAAEHIPGRQRSASSPFSRPAAIDVVDSPLMPSPPPLSPETATMWSTPRGSTAGTGPSSTTGTGASPPTSAEDSDAGSVGEKKKKKSKMTKELGALGVYVRGLKYPGFRSSEAKTYNHIFSFAERTFGNLWDKDAETKTLLEEHNMHHFMRVYPSGYRINSSNFDPLKFWRRGVQMVALNWQTRDHGMQLNEAMFAAGTDRTGYVLKPDELRCSPDPSDSSRCARRQKRKRQVRFHIEIISAQQLPRPRDLPQDSNVNPYIEFEVYSAEDKGRGVATGHGGTDASSRQGIFGIGSPVRKRTRIVEGNGYDPNFHEQISIAVETRYPSLIFVRWTVWNSHDARTVNAGNVPLATFAAKLTSLQQGYRHLPLYDANGEQYLFSTLFCKIRKEDQVSVLEEGPTEGAPTGIPTSPSQEGRAGGIFKRVFNRTPSQARTERKEQSDTSGPVSRSSTFEK